MKYEEFKKEFEESVLPNKPEYIREGQALINYLGEIWLKEYKRISSVHYYDRTDIDCFFNDSLIPNTWVHLKEVWWAYPN